MTSFSERMGLIKNRETLQMDDMDKALRNGLWNVFLQDYWLKTGYHALNFFHDLYKYFLNEPIDEVSTHDNGTFILKQIILEEPWYYVYDFLEFAVEKKSPSVDLNVFIENCNAVLQKEMSAFRFIHGVITPISNESEMSSIQEAVSKSEKLFAVKTHLKEALKKMSDRKDPDYRNSKKESISAVEALCKLITQDDSASLGEALKIIKKEEKIKIHSAFEGALTRLYGYTSDASGIRHSLLNESDLDLEDSKFMLVSCSAFINYFLVKCEKSGIEF